MRSLITYLGHSSFLIKWKEGEILIDPFFSENDYYFFESIKLTHIFLTHGHGDHLGISLELYNKYKPKIIGAYELTLFLNKKGIKEEDLISINFGGYNNFPFGKVKMVFALHSSSNLENGNIIYTGNPCGYIFKFEDRSIYHMGDTGLSYEFKLIGETEKIDILLIPIGGYYTMDINDAITAVNMIKSEYVIPMHYETFPEIKIDPVLFKKRVENETSSKCIILKKGESF
ncbi:MAG: metal-dependent hydrolase [Caldisericia bacterium]|nr:metal-dependent hydrolase [Caldisericia bacterium]